MSQADSRERDEGNEYQATQDIGYFAPRDYVQERASGSAAAAPGIWWFCAFSKGHRVCPCLGFCETASIRKSTDVYLPT